jgi:solute carrier family 25 thiamine pyrophosphate transporter 19
MRYRVLPILHKTPPIDSVIQGSRTQVILAGGVAGLVSRFCIAPLDVIKIRLQLQTHSLSDPRSHQGIQGPTYKGILPSLKTIVSQEGITGLWKGNIPAELLYVCYGGAQFTSYRSISQLQAALPYRFPSAVESFISGAGAGAIATTATYPLDLLRTRFAAQGSEKIYASLLGSIRDIARDEGSRGFFRGVGAANFQIVPYMGLFFATYEALRLQIGTTHLPYGSGDATAGVLASVFAKTVVFPLDLVRKRLQVQGPTRSRYVHRNIPEYRGVVRTLRTILRMEGVRGAYRGLTVSLVKAAPASAVTMWTYERVLHFLMHVDTAT